MANTTNFGWETPDDTDLVKDGAAAIRTLGSAIDTSFIDLKGGTTGQVLSKASNTDLDYQWIGVGDITEVTATSPLTGGGTTGAITVGIQDGTTAQKGAVQLTNSTSSTSTTTAAVPASVKTAYDRTFNNFTLLNTGGTALTGAATVTVSGISNKNQLYIVVSGASSANASAEIWLRLNTDTASNYAYVALYNQAGTGADSTFNLNDSKYFLGIMSSSASGTVTASILVSGADSTGRKPISSVSSAAGSTSWSVAGHGDYRGTSTISSISIVSSTGNLDAGTVFVYGA